MIGGLKEQSYSSVDGAGESEPTGANSEIQKYFDQEIEEI